MFLSLLVSGQQLPCWLRCDHWLYEFGRFDSDSCLRHKFRVFGVSSRTCTMKNPGAGKGCLGKQQLSKEKACKSAMEHWCARLWVCLTTANYIERVRWPSQNLCTDVHPFQWMRESPCLATFFPDVLLDSAEIRACTAWISRDALISSFGVDQQPGKLGEEWGTNNVGDPGGTGRTGDSRYDVLTVGAMW